VRDSANLDQLVIDHLPAALRFATRLTGDADRAEELVQQALLRVVRRFSSFRGESEFRTWLLRIVINVFRDGLRAASAQLPLADESPSDLVDRSVAEPSEAAMAAELGQRIAQEVSRLPARQREVLVLVTYEGLSIRETASVVGISEGNVHSTLSAARARLKVRLARYLRPAERSPDAN
jgi:RNA polymerase sigma-70 factor (ECF subfamily)